MSQVSMTSFPVVERLNIIEHIGFIFFWYLLETEYFMAQLPGFQMLINQLLILAIDVPDL
jgi:hypothetical protein